MWKQKRYIIPNSNHKLIIASNVLKKFVKNLQDNSKFESGGLLFANINLPLITIKNASGPNNTDFRRCNYFKPDQLIQQIEINSMFKKKLHFVGEWHTHPESIPSPSVLDLNSMKESFSESIHELNYFIMIIVGNKVSNNMLWVGLHNNKECIRLIEEVYH